ncbi:Ig-like domain-containing protein [Ornithinimicrobium sufpigmenti]|uniref:Ig-like domain-containing protein n=1 Tax=Ornithinimicrobium sufpigmenti TaxID=2508882 RepID=UPI0015E1B600|nr:MULTISPECIES: Ig-like domain-containing protein [unclassified Ornithinimicrobium]
MTDRRSLKVIVFGALAMLLAFTMPGFSTATFTSSSSNTATVSAAADWVAPKVSIVDLPAQASGTQALRAQASDEFGTGVASVTIETRQTGGTWAALCTDTSAPYECVWNTTSLSSGNYEVRARATDRAGLIGTSETVATSVANGRLVLDHPGQPVSGSPTLTARMSGWVLHTLRIDYRESGGRWQPLCAGVTRELSCPWDTTQLKDGQYDLRARAIWIVPTDEHIIYDVTVDNAGVLRPRAANIGPEATDPAADSVDKGQVGPDVRRVSPVERRPVDPPVEDEPNDEAVVEPAPEEPPMLPGDDNDQTVPGDDEDETIPGDEEDIEEPELRGVGLTAINGGTAGSLDEGDAFAFTYSGAVDLGTVLPGWSGEATPVSVRLRDGALLGASAQDDTFDVRSGDLPVEVGQVHLGADVIDVEQQILLPATMTAQTVTVDGAIQTTVTVTLAAVNDEDEVMQPAPAAVLTWTPSAVVTSLTGRACVADPVTQTEGSF